MNSSYIAKLAGVSRSTVSRILNGYDDISYETRKKVEAIIKEYNYIPNSYGRGLAGKANRIIGLFIVDVDNWSEDNMVLSRSEVFCDFLAYAADIAHNLCYNILVSIIDRKNYGDIRRLFADKSICAGLIMGDTYDQEVIDELGREGYKIALHNQRDRSEMENVINVNVAYTVGYALSFVANFYLTAYFTFGQKPSWGKAFGFGGAHLCNYLLHMGLLNLFLYLGLSKPLAPIPVFAIAIPANFLMVKFVFRKKKVEMRTDMDSDN